MSETNDIPGTHDRPEIVKARARVIIVETVWKWFLALVVTTILVLVVVDTLQGREVRNELVDCTTPGGECYQEGQERTGKVVEQLYEQGLDREAVTRQIIVLAAACAGDESNRTTEAIAACVNERMAQENQINIKEIP